ncbi:MAG: MnhB domain-containing protein [Oligoflexus sp.]
MNSVITRTTFLLLLPLMIIASLVILFRGHNLPGGGFAGGLLFALALYLYMVLYQKKIFRTKICEYFPELVASGITLMLFCAVLPILLGENFLKGLWSSWAIPGLGKLSTVLLFDMGLFIVVASSVLFVLSRIEEES